MSTIAKLRVDIGADISELKQAMSRAQSAIENTSRRMTEMGKTLSTRITAPLVALGGVAVRAFGQQEQAEMRLRAALQANGRQVDNLFNRYNAFAQEMQRVTVVGDEATLAMLAQAEAMGLTGESAEQAVRNSIAMQSAFGVSAERALRYTAALEMGEATMLRRYIPALRGITDETEMVAKAQEILTGAFSAAEAEAKGVTGQFQQMRNALGDMMEDIGEVISVALLPMIQRIRELAEQFQQLDRQKQAMIVTVGLLAAALGPLLLVLGKIGAVIAALNIKIIAVIAAIAGIVLALDYVRRNMTAFRKFFADEWDKTVNDLVYNLQLALRALNMFIRVLDPSRMGIEPVIASLDNLKRAVPDREDGYGFQSFGEFISDVGSDIMGMLGWLTEKMFGFGEEAQKSVGAATESFREFGASVERATTSVAMFTSSLDVANQWVHRVSTAAKGIPEHLRSAYEIAQQELDKMNAGMMFAQDVAIRFTDSFGQGMANVIAYGDRLIDTLKNIGRLLMSSAIQTGLRMLLMGSTGGAGGIAGGLLGRIFNVNDALITSGGDVVKFHPDDNILAMKDFSALGGGTDKMKIEVFGRLRGEDIFVTGERGKNRFNR